MSAERDRETILARRRFFVASAIASVVATGCDKVTPQPCLEPPLATDAANPNVCLAYPGPRDAALPEPTDDDAGSDASVGLAEPPDAAEPTPCLSVVRHRDGGPGPRICLSPPRLPDKK